jgi:hypothetical protein
MDYQGTINVTLQYISSASRTVQVVINNVIVATWTLPSTSGALGSYTGTLTLPALGNYIRFQGASGTLDLDRIYVDPLDGSGGFDPEIDRTGLIDPTTTFPTNLDDNRPYFNHRPATTSTGLTSATLGLANGRVCTYNGTTNQEIDQLFQTKLGSAAQAYRNRACVMFEELELVNGAVPQYTVEVDEGTRTVDVAVTKLFALVNIPSTKLDVTALASIGFRGLVISSRSEVRPYIEALQIAYNFDFVEADGKLKAVVRGTPTVTSIPQADLRMHAVGQDSAKGPVSITRIEEKSLPRLVTVQYLDPALSFKNNAQQATRHAGKTEDNETVVLPLVLSSDEAQAIAQRLLYIRHVERKQFEWTTSWKYLHLVPTGLVDLVLSGVTHRVRITEMQFAMPGLIKFKGVAYDASIYTQTGYGARTGYERPVLETPANTQLWMGKLPPLRFEDARFGYYWAGCPRGKGSWNGFQFYREEIAASGVYAHLAGTERPSMIGVVVGVLPSVADPNAWDTTSSLIVDFYYDDDSIQSRTQSDLIASPVLNRAAAGTGANIEILQFATATPQTASSPYVSRYLFTTLRRGRNNTQGAVGSHVAGEPFIILSDAVEFMSEDASQSSQTCNFKAVSIGQALTDTPAYSFLLQGLPGAGTIGTKTITAKYNSAGHLTQFIRGVYTFPPYTFGAMRARVYLTPPGGSEEETDTILVPNASNQQAFVFTARGKGTHTVRIVAELASTSTPSASSVSTTFSVVADSVTIGDITNFEISPQVPSAGSQSVAWTEPSDVVTNPEKILRYEVYQSVTGATWVGGGSVSPDYGTGGTGVNLVYAGRKPQFFIDRLNPFYGNSYYVRAIDSQGNVSRWYGSALPLSYLGSPLTAPTASINTSASAGDRIVLALTTVLTDLQVSSTIVQI